MRLYLWKKRQNCHSCMASHNWNTNFPRVKSQNFSLCHYERLRKYHCESSKQSLTSNGWKLAVVVRCAARLVILNLQLPLVCHGIVLSTSKYCLWTVLHRSSFLQSNSDHELQALTMVIERKVSHGSQEVSTNWIVHARKQLNKTSCTMIQYTGLLYKGWRMRDIVGINMDLEPSEICRRISTKRNLRRYIPQKYWLSQHQAL